MDLDRARGVLVVRVVADAEHGRVDGGARGGRNRGGVFKVEDGVRGALARERSVVCGGGHRGAVGGDGGVVERAEAVVDAGVEVRVPVYAEAGEGDVGCGDAELEG